MGDDYSIKLDGYDSMITSSPVTGVYTVDSASLSSVDWITSNSITIGPEYNLNGKFIDFEILEKYPTANTLYNQFISVYNMCEEEEKLNGGKDDLPF